MAGGFFVGFAQKIVLKRDFDIDSVSWLPFTAIGIIFCTILTVIIELIITDAGWVEPPMIEQIFLVVSIWSILGILHWFCLKKNFKHSHWIIIADGTSYPVGYLVHDYIYYLLRKIIGNLEIRCCTDGKVITTIKDGYISISNPSAYKVMDELSSIIGVFFGAGICAVITGVVVFKLSEINYDNQEIKKN